jgi:protein gp37
MRLAARLAAIGQDKYVGTTRKSGGRAKWNGTIKTDVSTLDIPRRWKKGRMIFVNSMSDLFHEAVPLAFIKAVFKVMAETPQHTYQVLTKRAERLEELSRKLPSLRNVWMGVSVENEDYAYRIDHLRRTKAQTKFLSLEPLLGPLDQLDLRDIHWAIVGGESGPGARPMHKDWVRSIRDQCINADVPFHFKQWGGKNKKLTGRILDGRTWDEWPHTKKKTSRARPALTRASV